jgi:hypothetical protein
VFITALPDVSEAPSSVAWTNSERLTELRERLANLSWLMRCLCEKIARAANHEEGSSGRFWAGRFKSVELLDEAAILACSVYVDLNPIRAGLASTPEESAHTSGCDRIRSMLETSTMPIQVEHYVMLLDWTGRELRADKRGAIPDHLAPVMDRLGLNRSNWVETVRDFGRLFKQAAGRPSSLVDAAARLAALVPGQGGGSNRLCVGCWLDAEP